MNANDTSAAPLTSAQRRILALVAERPGLQFSHKWLDSKITDYTTTPWGRGPDRSYYKVWDDNDGQYSSRTSLQTVHGLIDSGLLPLAVLVKSIACRYNSHTSGLQYRPTVNGDRIDKADDIMAQADACSEYLSWTPAAIRAAIYRGTLGYDEDGQLSDVCASCGNTSPDWSSWCSCW